MEPRLLRIEEKLDQLVDTQTEIKLSLQEHMRRTELAEQGIAALTAQMGPVQEHVALMRLGGKMVGGLVTVLGAIASLFKIFGGHK